MTHCDQYYHNQTHQIHPHNLNNHHKQNSNQCWNEKNDYMKDLRKGITTKNDLLQQIHEDRRKDKKKFFVAKKVAIAILLQFY